MSRTIVPQNLRRYTTLDQLAAVLEHSERDMLVVLSPGNGAAEIWPLQHPCGYPETHPKAIRVPSSMNGQTTDYIREKLNAIDGWAITGDVPKTPDEDWQDFAVQQVLDLMTPPESMRHRVWRLLKERGPMTPARMAERVGKTNRIMSSLMHNYRHKGDCTSIQSHPSGNGKPTRLFIAAKEPPYSKHDALRSSSGATGELERARMILDILREHGPLTRRRIGEILNDGDRGCVTKALQLLRQRGIVRPEGPRNFPIWHLADEEEGAS